MLEVRAVWRERHGAPELGEIIRILHMPLNDYVPRGCVADPSRQNSSSSAVPDPQDPCVQELQRGIDILFTEGASFQDPKA